MLAAVMSTAAAGARTVNQVIVISPERDRVPAEIPVLADTGESLNDALMQAHAVLREFGCHEVVVLPADLPKISSAEIDALVKAGRAGGFAIAPDAAGGHECAVPASALLPFDFSSDLIVTDCICRKHDAHGLEPQDHSPARPGVRCGFAGRSEPAR